MKRKKLARILHRVAGSLDLAAFLKVANKALRKKIAGLKAELATATRELEAWNDHPNIVKCDTVHELLDAGHRFFLLKEEGLYCARWYKDRGSPNGVATLSEDTIGEALQNAVAAAKEAE